jgi:membrane peptidoglycan carboxypeptidase
MRGVRGINVAGGTFPARIWGAYMATALADKPVLDFQKPTYDYQTVSVDPKTGLLAQPYCPGRDVVLPTVLVPRKPCPRGPVDVSVFRDAPPATDTAGAAAGDMSGTAGAGSAAPSGVTDTAPAADGGSPAQAVPAQGGSPAQAPSPPPPSSEPQELSGTTSG